MNNHITLFHGRNCFYFEWASVRVWVSCKVPKLKVIYEMFSLSHFNGSEVINSQYSDTELYVEEDN